MLAYSIIYCSVHPCDLKYLYNIYFRKQLRISSKKRDSEAELCIELLKQDIKKATLEVRLLEKQFRYFDYKT